MNLLDDQSQRTTMSVTNPIYPSSFRSSGFTFFLSIRPARLSSEAEERGQWEEEGLVGLYLLVDSCSMH
jgi:hypothetical protein